MQVSIIEELVVGFETSLNSCRMFNQNGKCDFDIGIAAISNHVL